MAKINRKQVHEKYNGRCAYCGEKIHFKDMQVDHIIPKARFHQFAKRVEYDIDDIQNLNPTCRVCNNWKGGWLLEEFRHEISEQVNRLRKYSAQFRLAERYRRIVELETSVQFYFEFTYF